MRKLLFCFLVSIISCLDTYAVKAYPFPIQYKQADGTTVSVRLYGDADFHYMLTLDGVLVVNKDNNIYVAEITDDNKIVATNVLAHNVSERTKEEIVLAKAQKVESFISSESMKQMELLAKPVIPQSTPVCFPHEGTPRVLVFLVDFADKKFSVADPINNFDTHLNGVGHGVGVMKDLYTENNVTFHESHIYGSVAEYFDCVSFGKFRPQFDVMPNIIHLSQKEEYYGKSENMTALLKDVCTIADTLYNVDFSKYDANDDDYCDLVYIIFAGQGENAGGAPSTIWAKTGWLSNLGTYDGKKVHLYGVSPELSVEPTYIDGIGVFCHEFSHSMGMPDFYNTSNSSSTRPNQGMEYWSLLDWGSYLQNGIGSRPCSYNAWERWDMGWIDIPTIKENGHYIVNSRERENQNAFIIENPENDNEYLVLESVQKEEWGIGLLGHGLMVTHVNFDSSSFYVRNNRVNVTNGRPRMTIVPADGELYSTNNDIESMTALKAKASKDLFSQTTGFTELSRDQALPNFDWFTNATNQNISSTSPTYPNHVKIYNITENADGSIEFDVILDTTTGVADVTTERTKVSGKAYNLSGQEVNNGFRGIVIRNGKKYMK